MDQDQLLSAVRDTAGVASQADAHRAAEATLKALGERLAGGETKDLASQLPGDLARCLPAEGPGERFGVDEFYERVARYEGDECTKEEARRHARAVVAALKVSVTGGEVDDVVGQLPREYDDLLGTGPVQH